MSTLGVLTSLSEGCLVQQENEQRGISAHQRNVPPIASANVVAAKEAPSKGFITLSELEQICAATPTNYVVEGLIPGEDVHVVVGDSGIGKTPWAYQLGLCVAAGKPFLGHAVKQGLVLYYDLENGREEILQVSRSLCGHLGIGPFPSDFRVPSDDGDPVKLYEAIETHRPHLVIVDTLRAFRPRAEAGNDEMGSFINELKRVARQFRCAVLLLHHIRKPGENGAPSLETASVMEWLHQASGARALINQTNTRIALAPPSGSSS